MARLICLNKPFDVLSQFTDKGTEGTTRRTLSDFVSVPKVYPAGRLDRDSEGLLLLTDDGALQARISNPRHKMEKTYLAQVEGELDEAALKELRQGVMLKDGMTRPARARRPPSRSPKGRPVAPSRTLSLCPMFTPPGGSIATARGFCS